jgi:pentatricopeptide repeat protein
MKELDAHPNRVTYLSILKACHMTNSAEKARLIHDEIDASECGPSLVIRNALIDVYAKLGRLDEAKTVFCSMVLRDVASWGALISGYVQHSHSTFAVETFKEMLAENVQPDVAIFSSVVKACGQLEALAEGKLLHGLIIRGGFEVGSDISLGNTLIDMYGKCASVDDAQITFDSLVTQDAVSWSTLIAGYANNECELSAIMLFEEMQMRRMNPVKTTYLSVLRACGNVESLHHARMLHDKVMRNEELLDQEIGNSLLDVYAKCKQLRDAQRVFDGLPVRNDVSWNVLIAAYAVNNEHLLTLQLFEKMQEEGFKPSEITMSVVLKVCGSTKTLINGKSIHEKMVQNQVACDRVVQNSLLDMYVKCGNLKEAQKAFDEMLGKDVVSWGTIISGNIQHGCVSYAFELFDEMENKSVEPNDVILSAILKACGDSGVATEGMLIHNQVIQCGCDVNLVVGNTLIDMYGKLGNLDEARRVFNRMCIRDAVSWAAMIGGYAQHGYGSQHSASVGIDTFPTLAECSLD